MAVTMFTRFGNIRSLLNLGNVNAISATINCRQRLHTTPVSCLMDEQEFDKYFNEPIGKPPSSKKKMSKAMRVYLERAKQHDEFIKREVAEFEIGKRHLANMMGEDPDMFTQQDIDRSIEYLFPSGLYDPRARPLMRHPDEIYPSKKAAEFDVTGRPYHSMFYTSKPNYYQTLYNITEQIEMLNKAEDDLIANGKFPSEKDKMEVLGSIWLPKADVEQIFLEKLYDFEYQYLVASFERLMKHSLSINATDLVMKFRKALVTISHGTSVPPVSTDEDGRPYITVKTCQKKSAVADVTIRGAGSGLFNINGQDISYFEETRFREQDATIS